MQDRKKTFEILKTTIIILTLAFPFVLGAFPFYIFFNPDRTQWLKDNGFKGTDFNEEVQSTLKVILSLILVIEIVIIISYTSFR